MFRSLGALQCNALRDLYNSGQFGVVSQLPTEDEILTQDDEVKGAFSHTTRILLTRR